MFLRNRIGMKLGQGLVLLLMILGLGLFPPGTEGVNCYHCSSAGEYGQWKSSEPCGVPEAFNSRSVSCPDEDHCYKRIGNGRVNIKPAMFVQRGCLSEILPTGKKDKKGADKLFECQGKRGWAYASDVYVGCFNGTMNKTEPRKIRSLDGAPYAMDGDDKIYVCKGIFCNRETKVPPCPEKEESLFSFDLKGVLACLGYFLSVYFILDCVRRAKKANDGS